MKKHKATAPKSTEPAASSEKIEEKIRERAYELYQLRGNQICVGEQVADANSCPNGSQQTGVHHV